jgi:hypothetical protein
MAGSTTASLRQISAVTPTTRDRYMDFLRAASIGMVVLGHYLGTVITTTGAGSASGASSRCRPS